MAAKYAGALRLSTGTERKVDERRGVVVVRFEDSLDLIRSAPRSAVLRAFRATETYSAKRRRVA